MAHFFSVLPTGPKSAQISYDILFHNNGTLHNFYIISLRETQGTNDNWVCKCFILQRLDRKYIYIINRGMIWNLNIINSHYWSISMKRKIFYYYSLTFHISLFSENLRKTAWRKRSIKIISDYTFWFYSHCDFIVPKYVNQPWG